MSLEGRVDPSALPFLAAVGGGSVRTLKARAARCLRLRPDTCRLHEPLHAAKFALRSLARRSEQLEREVVELDRELDKLVQSAAPRTLELYGVGTQAASQLRVAAGENIGRLRSEAAFARICGAAPIEASSGLSLSRADSRPPRRTAG